MLKRFTGERMMEKILEMFYSVWLWISCRTKFIHRYNKDRDVSMRNAREALERAFTPQLKRMLENHSE